MANVHPLTAYRQRHRPPMTKTALARLLGVSKASITRWESNMRQISIAQVAFISRNTGIPAHELRPDLARIIRPPPPETATA